MRALSIINFTLAVLFVACSFYQVIYSLIRLSGKRRTFQAQKLCRYAVLIAARNEEAVIGQLLDSIREQDYPADLVDVFVVADNCTDHTAQTAREHGATVWERQDRERVGKGYALGFLLEHLDRDYAPGTFDGYFVFDADNLLDSRYITEMNKVFSSGNRIVTGYRNSKNFGDNWISAGHSLYFLRESEYMNRPRDYLGVSCVVAGTGFLFADALLREIGGWNYHLLSEDTEFTVDMLLRGEPIAYCGDAVLYDEQPTSLSQSVRQRSRWIKGYFQAIFSRGDFMGKLDRMGRFSRYDLVMNSLPIGVLALLTMLLNAAMFIACIVMAPWELKNLCLSVLAGTASAYGAAFVVGLLVLITEHKKIRCPMGKQILYAFTFPIFGATYLFAVLLALFGRGGWTPIRHTVALSISDLGGKQEK